eukprot:Rhum_TRINITY_DN14542_c17_g1::Rhum_TRINITY_DN14542_c17_g1_i1::g.97604::m.97604
MKLDQKSPGFSPALLPCFATAPPPPPAVPGEAPAPVPPPPRRPMPTSSQSASLSGEHRYDARAGRGCAAALCAARYWLVAASAAFAALRAARRAARASAASRKSLPWPPATATRAATTQARRSSTYRLYTGLVRMTCASSGLSQTTAGGDGCGGGGSAASSAGAAAAAAAAAFAGCAAGFAVFAGFAGGAGGDAAAASAETLEGEWPKEGGRDVTAVTMWTQAVHARRVASVPVQRGRVLFVGEARAVVVNGDPERKGDVREEALKVNPFVGRESLLVSSLRGQTLLLCDYTHAAKVTLCWWYAKKFGRNRAAPLLCANILSYLRSHDAEGLYNATEIHALLHLASVALFTTSAAASFPAFIEKHPDLLDPDVLLRHYSPELLSARQTRITYAEPDRRSLDGPMYPTDVGRMLLHDSPLLVREKSKLIRAGVEGDEDLDFLGRGSAPHDRALELLPVKPGRDVEGYADLRVSPRDRADKLVDLGPRTAFGAHGEQRKLREKRKN